RADNTSDPNRLRGILEGLGGLELPVVFPMHPRTKGAVKDGAIHTPNNIRVIEPLSYFDMLVAEENARAIGTDSGGVQREAYCLSIPCVTLRDETEWTETVDAGWNRLSGTSPASIREAFARVIQDEPPKTKPPIFGDGHAARQIADVLSAFLLQAD